MDHENKIDALKLDIVSRLGHSWYGETKSESIFEIAKPISKIGIGFDGLPEEILNSSIFTGNELAMLASVDTIPLQKNKESITLNTEEKHILAKKMLEDWLKVITKFKKVTPRDYEKALEKLNKKQ